MRTLPTLPLTLLVAAVVTVAVGLLDDQGWASYVIGAGLALTLWVMLFFGSFATTSPQRVAPVTYAAAAVLAVVLGAVMVAFGDQPTFWAVGFVLAGTIAGGTTAATRRERAAD